MDIRLLSKYVVNSQGSELGLLWDCFLRQCRNCYWYIITRVGVKYNWSSTQILQVLVIKYKYKYFAFSPIKYSSASSTDTPSTSTSVNIGWLICTGNGYHGKYQGGNSREIPPCPMITPVRIRDRIPQDKIPQGKIPTDKIPQDKIPQDRIPQHKK